MNEENQNTPQAKGNDAGAQPKKKRKKQRSAGKTFLIVVIWVVVIALIVFLTLLIASKVGQFDNIGDMIAYIRDQIR